MTRNDYLDGLLAALSDDAKAYLLVRLTTPVYDKPSDLVQRVYWLDLPERGNREPIRDVTPQGFALHGGSVAPGGYRKFKIAAIKTLREESMTGGRPSLDLKGAKDQVDKWEAAGLFDVKFLKKETA